MQLDNAYNMDIGCCDLFSYVDYHVNKSKKFEGVETRRFDCFADLALCSQANVETCEFWVMW